MHHDIRSDDVTNVVLSQWTVPKWTGVRGGGLEGIKGDGWERSGHSFPCTLWSSWIKCLQKDVGFFISFLLVGDGSDSERACWEPNSCPPPESSKCSVLVKVSLFLLSESSGRPRTHDCPASIFWVPRLHSLHRHVVCATMPSVHSWQPSIHQGLPLFHIKLL